MKFNKIWICLMICAPAAMADCPPGYASSGLTCSAVKVNPSRPADCPAGYKNTGLTCTRPGDTIAVGSRPADCPHGYTNIGSTCNSGLKVKLMAEMTCHADEFRKLTRCYKNCPSGYASTGETCTRAPDTVAASKMTCNAGEFGNAGRCYKICPANYTSSGETCTSTLWNASARCKELVDAVAAVENAGTKAAAIAGGAAKAIGLDELMKPLKDGMAKAEQTVAGITNLNGTIETELGRGFGGANFDSNTMKANLSNMQKHAAEVDGWFTSGNFCGDANAGSIAAQVQSFGMNSRSWAGLIPPSSTGEPMMSVSKSTNIEYQQKTGTFTRIHLIDSKGHVVKLLSLSLGVSTNKSKLMELSKTKSVEFYPHTTLGGMTGYGWGFGVAGKIGPFASLSGLFNARSPTDLMPAFSPLGGISLGLGEPDKGYSFSPSFGYTWKANSN